MNLSHFISLPLATFVISTAFNPGLAAHAQSNVVAVGRDQSQNAPPQTLKNGLDAAVWDAGQRGPLIAVAPESVYPAWQAELSRTGVGLDGLPVPFKRPPGPEQVPGGQYRVTDLADYFGRRLVRLQGSSVLAPTEMVILNTKLGKPDYFANLSQNEKLQMLQASLSAAQWKLLGSEAGLGASDLSGEQRELLISSLPDPMVIRKQRAGGADESGEKPVILSGSQRGSVRLRLNRVTHYSVAVAGDANASFNYSLPAEIVGMKQAVLILNDSPNQRVGIFGQPVKSTVPNRLKSQQIDFSSPALQSSISLTGLQTVGDMIARIRTTTRIEIYVDGQLAKRSLWVRAVDNQTVRAGEALQALCWSLTGAIRYVSDGNQSGVFILTDDVEGVGSRLAKIKDWIQAAQEHLTDIQGTLQESIRKQKPIQYIGFAANDPNALGEKVNRVVEEGWKTAQGRFMGATLPITDLSSQQQEIVRQGIASYDKSRATYNGEHRDLVNDGNVSVSVQIETALMVPGVGEVRNSSFNNFGNLEAMLPVPERVGPSAPNVNTKVPDTATIPANLPIGGVFCITPTTEDEARLAVQTAHERGIKQVWLVLPLVPGAANDSDVAMAKSKAFLAAAVIEAEKVKPALKIVAGVRLFRLPLSTAAVSSSQIDANARRAEVDVTITGESPSAVTRRRTATYIAAQVDPTFARLTRQQTYDWIAPETPGLSGRITRRLSEIAALSGVTGIALLDTSPPGYSLPSQTPFFREAEGSVNVGYTPATRVGFIRTAGYDPVDIASEMYVGNLDARLPFFSLSGLSMPLNNGAVNSSGKWNQFRSSLVAKTLTELYTSLIASLPKSGDGFPVYLQNLDTATAGNGWFARWEKKEGLPQRLPLELGQPQNAYQASLKASSVSLLDMAYKVPLPSSPQSPQMPTMVPVAPAVQFARQLNSVLKFNKGAWAGLVLNFSDVSVEKAVEVVQGVVSPGKASVR
jgi:hypothetical protein